MNEEMLLAIDEIAKQKGINKEDLLAALKTALISAYKKTYGASSSARVDIDDATGKIEMYSLRRVVEQVSSQNNYGEISFDEARLKNPLCELDDIVEAPVNIDDFGRLAAITAKQVIIQHIKEAERDVIFDEYTSKIDQVVTCVVGHQQRNGVILDLGKAEAFMQTSETMPGESYPKNKRIKVYVLEVKKTSRNPQILVSRSNVSLVKKLFAMEVPEIQAGIVQIVSASRDAGSRSKIAVRSNNPQVDPVGACVGQRGIRVESIVTELNNEKIDIIEWDPDPVTYIAKALSPAKVSLVYLNQEEKAARVIVNDDQLSLAIGRGGQNAFLAAKLTGWKIDIKKASDISQDDFNVNQPEESGNSATLSDLQRAFDSFDQNDEK